MWWQNAHNPGHFEAPRIRTFLPMSELTATGFQRLVQVARVSDVPDEAQLFRAGENDDLSIFLLQGRVELVGDGARRIVDAGTETARYALSNLKPRSYTGRAVADVRVLFVESALLDKLVAWDQMSKGTSQGVQVEELDYGDDPEWIMHILDNDIFRRIPTANIENLVSRFEPVPVEAGDSIIEQGKHGHDYFIISRGTCEVLRKSTGNTDPVRIAERGQGEGVGEEALISDKPRDATVRMLTDGLVMKLNKSDFDNLLKEPLLNWIDEEQVASRVDKGALLIDVRLEEEFQHGTLKGAVNVPLYLLRLKAERFDKHQHYIVFCDSGERSATAAFCLEVRGLESSVIRGGLNACTRLPRTQLAD